MFHAYLDVCDWLLLLSAIRFGLGDPHYTLKFSCHMFIHFSYICSFLIYSEHVFLSVLSYVLSWIEPPYGTQTEEIHSGLEPSSWFWVILFCSSSYSISHPILWWKGQDGLLWELPRPWCSSETPGYSIRFCQHSSTRSHSNLRLWISTWETHEVSYHVYLGVLLQHTWHRYCCALVCYYIQRYTYCSYSASYIRGTTCP